MDLTSLIGVIAGIGCVLLGMILEGGNPIFLVQPTAFIIVVGGATGATVLAFSGKTTLGAVSSLKEVFFPIKEKPQEIINMLVDLAMKARKEGLLALQSDITSIDDPFLKKGLELMTDGTDPHLLRELLETELRFFEEEFTQAGKFWESFGAFTPTVGILGAVLGLIHVMENLSDPSKLGGGIAVAFVATVYGVGFANLVFIPLGSKVKSKQSQVAVVREMMIEGILAIQAGESPNFIRQKLQVFNPGHAEAGKEGGE